MTRTLKYLLLAALGFCVSIFVFSATSFAGTIATGDDQSWLELLRPVYDSFVTGHYLAAGMAALGTAVILLRKYAPEKYGIKKFVYSDPGGVLLTLTASFAAAMFTSLASSGPSWAMTKTALLIAMGAAGGYSFVKKLLVEPFVRPWYAKTTGWKHTVLGLVLMVFDKPDTVQVAENAGDAAVEAKPPTGAAVPSEVKEVE